MSSRAAALVASLALVAAPCGAQRGARDSVPTAWRPAPAVEAALVARATRDWGTAPAGGWRGEFTLVRGDTTALDTLRADVVGHDVTGIYTVAVRPARGAAPVLVARLRVGAARPVVVAARTVSRGAVLAPADVRTEVVPAWGRPAADDTTAVAVDALVGARLRRVVRAGEPLRLADLEAAPVVQPGDTVVAEMVREGVRLTLPAVALRGGALGARVPLRAAQGRRLEGTVLSSTLVRLDR